MSKALTVQELPFTGERLVTSDQDHIQMIYEHLHRYLWACDQVLGKVVLDIACGEGYGTRLLAQRAERAIGVDIAANAVRHAARKYKHPNLKFLTGSCLKIPLENESVDFVVSFETIEHLETHDTFLLEIRRVLRPGGTLIISCPDKAEYTERLGQRNPFHKQELFHADFVGLLGRNFKNVTVARQRLVGGSYIAADRHEEKHVYGTFRGDFDGGTFAEGVYEGLYSIAVCSDLPLPALKFGLFENKGESAKMWNAFETASKVRDELAAQTEKARVLEVRVAEMERLDTRAQSERFSEEISGLRENAARLEAEIIRLTTLATESQEARAALDREVKERGAWGQGLEQSLRKAEAQGAELQKAVDEANLRTTRAGEDLAGLGQRLRKAEAQGAELQKAVDEANLRTTRAGEDLAGLEGQLAAAQSSLASLLSELETNIRSAAEREAAMRRKHEEGDSHAASLERELAKERQHRSILEDKVKRMQRSFSWKSTAMLRATRRALLDK